MMEDILSLKEAVLSYLDRSGGLLQLTEDCKSFKDSRQSEAVYRFRFNVNPTDVTDLDARLGDCILHDPLKATALFQSVCFLSIKTLSLIDQIHTENQVNVVLRPTHLPPFPKYFLDLSEFPRGYWPMRPLAMEGIVIAMTCVTKYTQGTRFLCTEESCPCSKGFHHIRVHAPGATESATVRGGFNCLLCTSPLKEDMKSRVLGDKQLVELVHVKALEALSVHPPTSLRYQSVTLFLRDELCGSVRIGRLYRAVGIPVHIHHQWPSVTWSVEACSVQPWTPETPCVLSRNFQALRAAAACSPWRFSAVVANSFGAAVVPPGLYSTLKLVLLLSLVQTEDHADPHHHLDVLALTSDRLILDRLMSYSLGLAARGVRHPVAGELLASLSRDEHGAGTANIHAGSALLATGGVCLLGDLSCYRKDKMDTLQSALESRAVSVFIPGKKYGEEADQHMAFPLQCNFWALTDKAASSKRQNAKCDAAVLGSVEMGSVPSQVAEAFGLVVQCRETGGNQPSLPQIVHTLRQAIQPSEPLYPACMQFTTQDYQQLLAHARSLRVKMSPEAEKLIHGYYMASRRVRSDPTQGSSVSVTSIKLLMALAAAHCKLSLRTLVLLEDAVVAVLLCENSITLKHGASVLVIPPDAMFPCDLHDLDSLHQRDVTLGQLQQQLLQFVYAYAPGAVHITEE